MKIYEELCIEPELMFYYAENDVCKQMPVFTIKAGRRKLLSLHSEENAKKILEILERD